jgi:hypothetical protein
MSYNGSGTFVINSTGQPVVTGTVISSSTFNAFTADIGTGLSTAITKNGQTTTTALIPFAFGISAAVSSSFAAGTVAAPSIYLATDTGTGFYRIGANNNGYSVSGTKLLDFSSALLAVTGAGTFSTTLAVTGATTLSSALTYGGVTLSNSVTGTGNMVLSASPTLTGTVSGATINASVGFNGVLGGTTPAAASVTTLTATGLVTVNTNGGTLPAAISGETFRTYAATGTDRWIKDAVGGSSTITFRRADGTSASPTAVQSNDAIMFLSSTGYGATGYVGGIQASVSAHASGNWTDTSAPTEIRLAATPSGSLNRVDAFFLTSTGINSTVIGATTPAAATVTTLSATTSITSIGSVGNVSTDSTGARLNFSRGSDNYFQATTAGGYFAWIVNNTGTNAMTLDASGNLLVGASALRSVERMIVEKNNDVIVAKSTGGVSAIPYLAWNTDTGGDAIFVSFGTEATYTARGSISYNRAGGLVSYNVTSDYRAKDIYGDFAGAGDIIDRLRIYSGQMKGATIARPMMIAHEAAAVVPYAVTGKKDAVDDKGDPIYQSMDHQIFVPLLIAEVQALRSRVALLERN